MADDTEAVDINITGGVKGDMSEFDNSTAKKAEADAADDHLKHRIEELEREKRDLVQEDQEIKTAELERSEMEKKAMESITKRAFELEGEVVRLQHDLATSMNAGDEANREIEELKREKRALLEKLSEQADEFKTLKSDSEGRISELEKEIEGAKRDKAEAEEQAKAQLDEMETEIIELKKQKKEVEDAMGALEAELKRSVEKVLKLLKKSEESEKAVQSEIDGIAEVGEGEGGLRGLKKKKKRKKKKKQFPVAGAVSAGVVVAALAVCYLRFSRTR